MTKGNFNNLVASEFGFNVNTFEYLYNNDFLEFLCLERRKERKNTHTHTQPKNVFETLVILPTQFALTTLSPQQSINHTSWRIWSLKTEMRTKCACRTSTYFDEEQFINDLLADKKDLKCCAQNCLPKVVEESIRTQSKLISFFFDIKTSYVCKRIFQ